ncbi:acyl-CoA dehydrogenase family protein [Mycolicibacterium moriokaense]|uniref:Alkylation response protein AidB-like acyl-CoA dehydrogenase n=1 Tax=Mycolicibacterium moriokaense TaxID=39691 RepID=A0A318HPJ6_9MYCO|nr:acyl-CoA dehydrogenase family protein [Mycolicibacterium moriokaense]PXX08834.1 alkylation response protein AidB-like acyl-CoA dehydrogenase [Mycolicibacterium moriokaense]
MTAILSATEEAQLRASVYGIVAKFGNDYYTRCSDTLQPPTELWDALAAGGFVGVNLPEAYGGGGMGLTAMSIVAEEAAAAGCPQIMLMISPGIVGSLLTRHATEEQKQRWLAPMAAGSVRIAFAITEPDAGSNSHHIATTARRDGDTYYISGQKTFITAADQTDALLVVARTGTDPSGRAQLSLFLVDRNAVGIEMHRIPMTFEITEKSFTVFFDNVAVHSDRVVGGEGKGLRVAFDGMNPERVIIASICNGIGRYAMEKAVSYARERQVWSVPIGAHQGVAHPLAEAKIALESARLMTRHAAAGYDSGIDAAEASNMAKFLAAEAATRCVDQAIEVHGGSGFTREVALANMYEFVRLFKTVPITRAMILNHIAQHSLGLPKSY